MRPLCQGHPPGPCGHRGLDGALPSARWGICPPDASTAAAVARDGCGSLWTSPNVSRSHPEDHGVGSRLGGSSEPAAVRGVQSRRKHPQTHLQCEVTGPE